MTLRVSAEFADLIQQAATSQRRSVSELVCVAVMTKYIQDPTTVDASAREVAGQEHVAVRLDRRQEDIITLMAEELDVSKSLWVRAALVDYIRVEEEQG